MPRRSAGLLMYRIRVGRIEVLLVHPGGPLWAKRDEGAWSIPKGEVAEGEDELGAAQREFAEELGTTPRGKFLELGEIQQKGGKTVRAWAFEGDLDPRKIKSNTFRMEWPPRSGRLQEFPEIDRAAFFAFEQAATKINPAQIPFLENLRRILKLQGGRS